MTLKKAFLLYARMSRPNQLLAVLLVYAWGTVVAARHGSLAIDPLIDGSLPLLLVSASIHYANEYADHETDALTIRTPFSGGSGALVDYGAQPVLALRDAWVALTLGLFAGILLVLIDALPGVALVMLMLGAAGGWMYSLPPLALAWRGWGELDNALLGGLLLPAYGYAVQSGALHLQIFLLALPFGLHVFVSLLATTWADREADRQVGKLTLATRWSSTRLRRLYFLVLLVAYALLFAFRGWLMPDSLVLTTLMILPFALGTGWAYTRWHSPFPSVVVMVSFVLVQLVGWLAMLVP